MVRRRSRVNPAGSTQVARALLRLRLGKISQSFDPGLGRANPDLPLGNELVALPQDPYPDHVRFLLPLSGRRRIDRRAAFRAERLDAPVAALGGFLVDRRLAPHFEGSARHGNTDAKRRPGARLTVGAMADRHLFRIGLGLDADEAAVAGTINFHDSIPSPSCVAPSMAAMSASDRPK